MPSSRSSDFEVHRNWLAITSSLPLPVVFRRHQPLDPRLPSPLRPHRALPVLLRRRRGPIITDLRRVIDYAADSVVYFQRLTVAVADLGLLFGVYLLAKRLELGRRRLVFVLFVLLPAMLIVDRIHFQYNGFLSGVLLISLALL